MSLYIWLSTPDPRSGVTWDSDPNTNETIGPMLPLAQKLVMTPRVTLTTCKY